MSPALLRPREVRVDRRVVANDDPGKRRRVEKLLQDPPVVRPYEEGSWGPNQVHQLVAPFTWRLPFERKWRSNKPADD